MESKKQQKPTLITPKEELTEETLVEIITNLITPPHLPAAEIGRIWREQIQAQLLEKYGVTFTSKTQNFVNLLLDVKLKQHLQTTFVRIHTIEPDMKTMVYKYSKFFDQWIDSSSQVSFKAINKLLLGNVDTKDVWILTFFAMLTNIRIRGDNLMMLGLSGKSTCGKSTLFEHILMEGAHVATNETGVGRYTVGSKPVLAFIDIPIKTLVDGKDVEKIKAIARTEIAVAKVHSATYTIPPVFLFYSSNERLMHHEFDNSPEAFIRWRTYGSQIVQTGRKPIPTEHINAIQNRFIELFVREKPQVDEKYVPKCGIFQRIHGVLGMFPRILTILDKYNTKDFHSPYLYLYALRAMARYASQYAEVTGDQNIKMTITHLVFKLASIDQHEALLAEL
jgi:hypothetical protein